MEESAAVNKTKMRIARKTDQRTCRANTKNLSVVVIETTSKEEYQVSRCRRKNLTVVDDEQRTTKTTAYEQRTTLMKDSLSGQPAIKTSSHSVNDKAIEKEQGLPETQQNAKFARGGNTSATAKNIYSKKLYTWLEKLEEPKEQRYC